MEFNLIDLYRIFLTKVEKEFKSALVKKAGINLKDLIISRDFENIDVDSITGIDGSDKIQFSIKGGNDNRFDVCIPVENQKFLNFTLVDNGYDEHIIRIPQRDLFSEYAAQACKQWLYNSEITQWARDREL